MQIRHKLKLCLLLLCFQKGCGEPSSHDNSSRSSYRNPLATQQDKDRSGEQHRDETGSHDKLSDDNHDHDNHDHEQKEDVASANEPLQVINAFTQACQDRLANKDRNSAQEQMVDQLLDRAQRDDCHEAYQVLAGMSKLDLSQAGLSDLALLSVLPNIKTLDLSNSDPQASSSNAISKLTSLNSLKNLTSLSIAGLMIEDISPLADLTALVELNIDGTLVTDLSPLAQLDQLTSLSAANTNIDSSNSQTCPLDTASPGIRKLCSQFKLDPQTLLLPVVFHLGNSQLWTNQEILRPVIAEVERILQQARIAMKPEYSQDLSPSADKLDVYFQPEVLASGNPVNGLSLGAATQVYIADNVGLRKVDDMRPAMVFLPRYFAGATPQSQISVSLQQAEQGRTTAHEIGHQLGLRHRQDNTNLMASGTTGWTLNAAEIMTMRTVAVMRFNAQPSALPEIASNN